VREPIRIRGLVIAAALLLGVGAALFLARHPLEAPGLQTLLQRRRDLQTLALRRYLARTDGARILPQNAVAIAVRAEFLQRVLESSLPYTQTFENGKYAARLDSAQVDLTDGLAVVILTGEGRLASDSTISARLSVEGSFGIARLDRASGQLVPQLAITDVRVIRAGPAGLRAVTNPAVRYFSRLKAEEWNHLDDALHFPLHLESVLKVPRVDGDISIPETQLPLAIRLAAVTSLRNLLVVSLDLLPDSAMVAKGGAAAEAPFEAWNDVNGTRAGPSLNATAFTALHERVRAAAARDTLWQAIQTADRDVAVVLPQPVLQDLAGRAARRLRGGAQVDFRPAIRESVDKDLGITVLGQKLGAGHIHVDIDVRHLRGTLTTPGAPDLAFQPPDELRIDLPLRIAEGAGDATFSAKWDPAALVSVVCKGFATRLELSGAILPVTHPVHGTVRFRLEGGRIVGHPEIRRDRVPLSFALDARSWAAIRRVLVAQDKVGRCSVGIDPDAIVAGLHRIGMKGVGVRLPRDLIPSFALPVVFEDSYARGPVQVAVVAYNPALVVERDYLRFAVDADLRLLQHAGP
jgi:hypothetical protein